MQDLALVQKLDMKLILWLSLLYLGSYMDWLVFSENIVLHKFTTVELTSTVKILT